MTHRSPLRLVALLLSTLLTPSLLHAAVPNRIGAITSGGRTELPHAVAGRTQRAADLGEAPAGQRLESVSLFFSRTDAQQTALSKLQIDQQNPSSPSYHQWLTPQQFGAQFGLSSSDLAKVTAWLSSQGLTVEYTAPSNNFVRFSGTVTQIEQALGVSMHRVSLAGEQHIANVTNPKLPTGLAAVVSGITGLNDFRLKSRVVSHIVKAPVAKPEFTSSLTGTNFLAPGDFSVIYDTKPLISSGINGTGVSIAVMGQTDISQSDVTAFRAAAGLSVNNPSVVLAGADPGVSTDSGDILEAQLDVEWSGAVAPGAHIIFVNSSDVLNTSLPYAIANKVAPIISISYGLCEQDSDNADLDSFNSLFQQANVQGETIVGPSGDSGATDCDFDSTTAADGLAVDFPASSPFVTGLGGTTFSEGSGTYWTTANGTDIINSALSYIPEAVWNDTSSTSGLSSGGGGASIFFSKPSWQTGTGVPADFSRDVPDVALSASPNHDPYLICANGSCTNGFRDSGSDLNTVGGTSAAAPSFAGILALLEQKIGASVGNANPILYGLFNSTFSANVFHDVISGNNDSPCIQGSPNCANGGSIGFSAGPGYDQASGLGSVDVNNLVTYWQQVAPAGAGSTTGSALSATTISTGSAASCGISTGSLPLTIAVANDSGTVIANAPTGGLQLLVDGTVTGTALTLANGTVAYTLNTSALSSGSHTISAAYPGDTTFAGSKGTLTIDVVSASAADFSITPCTPAVSVAAGAQATPITFTATPFNGFSGSIAFTASADASLTASYTFSVTPVVISSGNPGTTAFTLTASSSTTGAVKQGSGKVASVSGPHTGDVASRRTLYTAGSGIAVASLLLLTLPRRRRWAGLLAALVSVALVGSLGCGSSGTLLPSTGGGSPVTTVALPGTYFVTVTGVATTGGTTLVHSTRVQVTVTAQ